MYVSFDFKNPEECPKRLRILKHLRQASGFTEKSEEAQLNTMIHCIGGNADDILNPFKLSADGS